MGPYVKHGKVNATLPKDQVPEETTLARAVELIAERAAKVKTGGAGKGRRKKPAKTKSKPKPKT